MKKSITLVLIIILLYSCGSRQRQVWFVETQNSHQTEKLNTIKIYLDKQGSFYPNKEIYIPYKEFFDPKKENSTSKLQQTSGNLEHYFTGKFLTKKGKYSYWSFYDYTNRAKKLKKFYNLSKSTNNDEVFKKTQNKILSQTKDSLNYLLSQTKSKTLTIFIHGFNDPNPSADYNLLRKNIEQITNLDLVYLEVFWDGLTANQGSPPTSKIWSYAQFNSSQIAVTLRRIVNEINPKYKIRIITHSLGASVGTGLLFNTTSKWKNPESLGKYSDMIKNISAPKNNDIRIGMLAPAIPGQSTFIDFNNRTVSKHKKQKNTINKIVVGHNCNDYAVTKRFLGLDFLSSKAGSTTLGANYKGEVFKTKNVLKKLGYNNLLLSIDFKTLSSCGKDDEEHGLYYYMKNKVAFRKFVEEMFLK